MHTMITAGEGNTEVCKLRTLPLNFFSELELATIDTLLIAITHYCNKIGGGRHWGLIKKRPLLAAGDFGCTKVRYRLLYLSGGELIGCT